MKMHIKILNNFFRHYVYLRVRTRKDSLLRKKLSMEFIHTKFVERLIKLFFKSRAQFAPHIEFIFIQIIKDKIPSGMPAILNLTDFYTALQKFFMQFC